MHREKKVSMKTGQRHTASGLLFGIRSHGLRAHRNVLAVNQGFVTKGAFFLMVLTRRNIAQRPRCSKNRQ